MLPLQDQKILVTRSKDQVNNFTHQLEELGAKVLTLPLIENSPIHENELHHQFNSSPFDWIIFTSANAARFFFDTISPSSITSKIAVVGSKTEALLNELGVSVHFIPSIFTAKQLATELPIEPHQRILIPRSNLAKNDIVERLEGRGGRVETISIYENNAIQYTQEELDGVFLQKIDYITFTSGSTVKAFIGLGIPLKNEKVICIGPETALVAEQHHLNVTAIATPHTTEGMLQAILQNHQ